MDKLTQRVEEYYRYNFNHSAEPSDLVGLVRSELRRAEQIAQAAADEWGGYLINVHRDIRELME